ncbi:MAG: DUF523 and DUF1722 domain-containing protein [Proteobacteria bacterium]|nr:DUF523 and DUF1722 domain-containing protein [Pseudomonadota bacterium]MBU4471090.1 DUF523 and DUF1722 domain-containing protein [Pseudomonadota bacterium]MCG2750213.1 DUF523 and DUF1722 domain-containing protein [Desulfobacteraceae bacterium]
MDNPLKIGISRCLQGENVRYDGGHSQDHFLTDTLGLYVSYVPVCPEVECGMSIPREAMRLMGDSQSPRLVTTRTGEDKTGLMQKWISPKLSSLEKENLCGFIFKKNSPSSGLFKVKVYGDSGIPQKTGVGLFARAFTERFPLIPVEEDGRLNDPKLREMFIEQIFTMKRWRELLAQPRRLGALVDFHTRHKLLIFSHSQNQYRAMGKLIALGKSIPTASLYDLYEKKLMEALKLATTVKKNANVLQHMMGYFKKDLSADEKKEMLEILDQYAKEEVPLIVPITLLNHYVRKYQQAYLSDQVYLNPHPLALKLRNHA